jgi:hypothetical protein
MSSWDFQKHSRIHHIGKLSRNPKWFVAGNLRSFLRLCRSICGKLRFSVKPSFNYCGCAAVSIAGVEKT